MVAQMRPMLETRSQLRVVNKEIIACRQCPRLVKYREKVAREKRRAYCEWTFWGKPVPGFGDAGAQLLILGIATAIQCSITMERSFYGGRCVTCYFASWTMF